jgi:hypothetical protein
MQTVGAFATVTQDVCAVANSYDSHGNSERPNDVSNLCRKELGAKSHGVQPGRN